MREKSNIMFFHFSAEDTIEKIEERLKDFTQIGIRNILASYTTDGMAQAKFDGKYFAALDCLAAACEKEGIKFWLEDYAPFPTGSANGAYKEPEYAGLNKLFLDERHVDLTGPLKEAVIRIDSLTNVVYGKSIHRFAKVDPEGRKRIGTVAVRMKENPENAASPYLEEETAVLLNDQIENGFLKWDVPEGYWRIFVLYTTYESSGRPAFMNLLSRDSVALEIEKVHKPLYEHLKEKLGKTWIGFFYDEPETGNAGGGTVFDYFMLPGRRTMEATDCNVFPWSPEMPKEMERRTENWVKRLPALWYDGIGEGYRDFRCMYMDAVSELIKENYNGQVYSFCQERGIGYLGHVLEDENCHTRLGCGPAHYFRQQYYQDEAGIDVIAGQILPGKDRSASWYGVVNADGEFYHYGLAKLASSEAHINPLKKNRSMAECFAMYGQQGLAERKFLLDHLLVNGVNRMLLAELPSYQASYKYSKMLADYTERMCGLLRSCEPVIKTAVLYHAENEWREGVRVQKFQKAGAALARAQISYDVIPADVFTYPERYNTDTEKELKVNGHTYEALILPACEKLPEAVERFTEKCKETGFPVFMAETTDGLSDRVREAVKADVLVEGEGKEWIRFSHIKKDKAHYYLLHNESPAGGINAGVTVCADNDVLEWDVMADRMIRPQQEKTADHKRQVFLSFGRYEMKVLVVRENPHMSQGVTEIAQREAHSGDWEMEFPDGYKLSASPGELPKPERHVGYDFYGKLTYQTTYEANECLPKFLDLGNVSDCCEVFINGQSVGMRAGTPYVYDVGSLVKRGENKITIEVYTSASNRKSSASFAGVSLDSLTALPYTQIEPMGIRGPVRWLR